MPGVVRQGDPDTSLHVPEQYSSTVKVEGKAVFRHGDEDTVAHVVSDGAGLAAKVFIEGKAVVVVGDQDSGLNTKDVGSGTVSVG